MELHVNPPITKPHQTAVTTAPGVNITVANAFSIQMLGHVTEGDSVGITLTRISSPEAIRLVNGARRLVSAIGHQDTATILSRELGVYLPQNRISVELSPDTTILVAQVVGGRLPEGATELPEGTTIQYWKVQREAPLSQKEQTKAFASYRELAPEQFWAGAIHCPSDMSRSEFLNAIAAYAKDKGITISGFVRQSESNGTIFEITRYPRRAFGPLASIESFETHLARLSGELHTTVERPQFPSPIFRAVLGLIEGYEKPAVTHKPSEVERKLRGCDRITAVDIFVAGPWGTYEEPAVLIEGPPTEINNLLHVADSFRQARLCIENVGPTGGTAHMVEFSNWCKDPDPH